ncbi:MAG TPA: calcium-binding protein, partial [Rhizomicrobium sp.]|nr:calcium-binding protein [Rhizomicrobium sp.]
ITGNALANTLDGRDGNDILNGGDGNDVLTGGAGADEMHGGNGNDLYSADNAGDTIVERDSTKGGRDTVFVTGLTQFTLVAGVENLTYAGSADFHAIGNHAANVVLTGDGNDTLSGAEGDDILDAGAGADTLDGGTGNDRLDGGAGADRMTGGLGNDTYYVDNKGDVVIEKAGEGTDTVYSEISYVLGSTLEKLVLMGGKSIDGTGNGLDNALTGNWSDNVLDGKGGQDRMEGLGGNDTYIVDDIRDKVIESANNGHDTIRAKVSFTLSSNVEDGVLLGTANISMTGNAADNKLIGNDGNNTLSGGRGIDQLLGGNGDDTLVGGAEGDTLRGGLGADRFVFTNTSDSQAGARDTIMDFSHADGDRIDLRQIDAIAGGSDNAFHLVAALDGHAGQLAVTAQGANWLVSGDTDGDGNADFLLLVKSATALVQQDFLL